MNVHIETTVDISVVNEEWKMGNTMENKWEVNGKWMENEFGF